MDRPETLTLPKSSKTRDQTCLPDMRKHAFFTGTTRIFFFAAFLFLQLSACSWFEDSFKTAQFVGKWKSSRTETPVRLFNNGEWEIRAPDGSGQQYETSIRLYNNGEWEIQAPDGSVQQYGVWQLVDKKILWSNLHNGRISHEEKTVLAVSPREFKLRERNGSTTTFVKID